MQWLISLFGWIKLAITAWTAYRAGESAEAEKVHDQGQQAEIKVDDAILNARKSDDGTLSGATRALQRGKF